MLAIGAGFQRVGIASGGRIVNEHHAARQGLCLVAFGRGIERNGRVHVAVPLHELGNAGDQGFQPIGSVVKPALMEAAALAIVGVAFNAAQLQPSALVAK